MDLIKDNKELIFEIRDKKQKSDWFKHMLLICVIGISGGYYLKYYLKPSENCFNQKWEIATYIPLDEKIKWYISKLTKTDIENSINEVGIN
jgi:hypothetical protein